MIKKFKSIFNQEQFRPTFLGLFLNPFYFARKGLFDHISSLAPQVTGKILDVGCGNKPYQDLFDSSSYVGLEIDSAENLSNSKADFFYDGEVFPFPDAEYNSIVINQVFEHVFTPDRFLDEVNRVLKDGGVLLMTVPFVWDEHEQPVDFARYSSFGLRKLLGNHGFEILEQRKSMDDIRAVVQLVNVYLFKKISTGNNYLNFLLTLFLMAPWNIVGEMLAKVLPDNGDFYLDNIVLARKVADV